MPKIQLDLARLKKRCGMELAAFEGDVWSTPGKKAPRQWYKFVDRGAKHLAVAHLDHVSQNPDFAEARIRGRRCIFNGALDDRLGTYIILDLLPALGITDFDVLLTTDEETGGSTAGIFVPPKDRAYNWIFEFDRRGLDCAMYTFSSAEWNAKVKQYGWNPVHGSFTDICRLDKLGCMAFNFGTGYVDEHQELCRVYLADLLQSVAWFIKFWKDNAGRHLPFEPPKTPPAATYSYGSYGGSRELWQEGEEWDYNPNTQTWRYKRSPSADQRYAAWKKRYCIPTESEEPQDTPPPEPEDVPPCPDQGYSLDYCLECGEFHEVDPALFLCRVCAEDYARAGYGQLSYKYKLTEGEEDAAIARYCGSRRRASSAAGGCL